MKKEDYTSIQVTKKFQLRLAYLCLRRKKSTYEKLIQQLAKESTAYRKQQTEQSKIVTATD